MDYLAIFFAGAFICNCLPHLISGLQGRVFPTPFAKPSGRGDSSALVNFLWGAVNLLAATALLANHPATVGFNLKFLSLLGGFLLLGVLTSRHFAQVRREKQEKI